MTENIFKMIKENEVKFVDFRFTDPKGKWQHTAQTVESVMKICLIIVLCLMGHQFQVGNQ